MKCVKRLDGQVYAIKKMKHALTSRAGLREVVAMAALQDSAHTVRYYHAWVEEGHVYLQMECMDYSLDKVDTPLSEAVLANVLRDVLLGLVEMHSANMVHLDVKVRERCRFRS